MTRSDQTTMRPGCGGGRIYSPSRWRVAAGSPQAPYERPSASQQTPRHRSVRIFETCPLVLVDIPFVGLGNDVDCHAHALDGRCSLTVAKGEVRLASVKESKLGPCASGTRMPRKVSDIPAQRLRRRRRKKATSEEAVEAV